MVVGLEVHVQLKTRTKMFCGCENRFGAEPNTLTCPVCLGQPGSLPAINRTAVEYAVRVGLACGCRIARSRGRCTARTVARDTGRGGAHLASRALARAGASSRALRQA